MGEVESKVGKKEGREEEREEDGLGKRTWRYNTRSITKQMYNPTGLACCSEHSI